MLCSIVISSLILVALAAGPPGGPTPVPLNAHRFIHVSDLHLDLLSEPDKYGPYQFCRNPKNMPHEEALKRSLQFMIEDGHALGNTLLLRHDTNKERTRLNALAAKYNVPFGWMLCDSYPAMVEALFADMAGQLPYPDFMVITGDWAAHLQLSLTTMTQAIHKGASIIQKNFPNTVVVPVIGNNDVFPDYNQTSCYQPQTVAVYMQWSQWIDKSQIPNFLNFGGFEAHVNGGKLRIFSINTVFYHQRNKHYANVTDPCGQMAWLKAALAQARQDGARVIITGHIPPKTQPTSPSQAGYFWWPFHQTPFLDILHDNADITATTLWGHTHHDEFWIDQRANSTVAGLIAPSITPLPSYPSYRMGQMGPNFDVIDYLQRHLKLDAASKSGVFQMETEYSFAQSYNITDLTPANLLIMREKVFANRSLAADYKMRYFAGYDDELYADLCATVSSNDDYWACQMSKPKF